MVPDGGSAAQTAPGTRTAPGRRGEPPPTPPRRRIDSEDGRPGVKLRLQALHKKRWSGFGRPFRPTGALAVFPLGLVSKFLQRGHRTRRFGPPSTSLSGCFPDSYHQGGSSPGISSCGGPTQPDAPRNREVSTSDDLSSRGDGYPAEASASRMRGPLTVRRPLSWGWVRRED